MIVSLVICVFAIYRAALLIYEEAGPFGVIERLREGVQKHPWRFNPGPDGDLFRALGEGLECFRCLSVWVALPVAVWLRWPDVVWMLLTWLALSGGAIIIKEAIDHEA